jgi:hypothetical protein
VEPSSAYWIDTATETHVDHDTKTITVTTLDGTILTYVQNGDGFWTLGGRVDLEAQYSLNRVFLGGPPPVSDPVQPRKAS